jgi:hypothetical protein
MPANYNLKQVTAEALQYDESNDQAFVDWLAPLGYMVVITGPPNNQRTLVSLNTTGMSGKVYLEDGYWIAKRSDMVDLQYLSNEQFLAMYTGV